MSNLQNQALFSNLVTKRATSTYCHSKQSTINNIRDTTREEQNRNYITRFNQIETKKSYKTIHNNRLEPISKPQVDTVFRPTLVMIKSAIKIQRYWRFHLTMRRRMHQQIIKSLTIQNLYLNRLMINQENKYKMIHANITQIQAKNKHNFDQYLKVCKDYKKQVVQKFIIPTLVQSSQQKKLQKVWQNQNNEIESSISDYNSIRVKIEELRKNKQKLLKKEKQYINTISALNKKLLQESIQKSQIQLQIDEINMRKNSIKCNIN